jgi:hypothetical protein
MKEKRQQRDDNQSRSFSLPTGGVDIAQLVAMGMPCPPPHNLNRNSMIQYTGLIGTPHISPSQQLSQYPGFYNSPYNSSYDRLSPQLGQHSF